MKGESSMIYCTFDYIDIHGDICKRSLINYNTPDTIEGCRYYVKRIFCVFEGIVKAEIWEDNKVVESVYAVSEFGKG